MIVTSFNRNAVVPLSVGARHGRPGCRALTGGDLFGGDHFADLPSIAVLCLDQFLAVGFHRVRELEQQQLALAGCGVLPALESRGRRGHRIIDVGFN